MDGGSNGVGTDGIWRPWDEHCAPPGRDGVRAAVPPARARRQPVHLLHRQAHQGAPPNRKKHMPTSSFMHRFCMRRMPSKTKFVTKKFLVVACL